MFRLLFLGILMFIAGCAGPVEVSHVRRLQCDGQLVTFRFMTDDSVLLMLDNQKIVLNRLSWPQDHVYRDVNGHTELRLRPKGTSLRCGSSVYENCRSPVYLDQTPPLKGMQESQSR